MRVEAIRSVVLLVAASALLHGAPAASQVRRPFVPRDIARLTDLGEAQISPDGTRVVLTISTIREQENRRDTRVLLLPAAGGPAVDILADGPSGASTFRWAPDSRRLAFIGVRDGRTAIWTYDVASGAIDRVADYDRSNAHLAAIGEALAWSPDGRHIAYVATTDPVEHQEPVVITRLQYKSRTALADNRRMHVFVVPSQGGEPIQLTSGDHDEHSIAWTPDGREIVFLSNREPDPDAFHNYDIYAVNVESRAIRQLTRTRGVEMSPRVSPDGRWIAFRATTRPLTTIDSVAEDAHLRVMPAAGGEARVVNRQFDRRTIAFEWSPDSASLVFAAQDRGKVLLYKVPLDGGAAVPLFDRPVQVSGFSMATDGTLVFGLRSAVAPRELYRLALDARTPEPLTSFNAEVLRGWQLSEPEAFTFVADDGVEIEGWFYPAIGTKGRVPLLLNIHGGPHGMFGYAFDPMVQGYAGHGYAVVNVNPRGSTGYGQAFSDGSLDDWGGRDYRDLMQAVDHVLATREEIDPARLGVTGRSYGGYMTNWIITQTDRFKAAVSVASVANLISFYGTSIYQDLVHAEFSGFP